MCDEEQFNCERGSLVNTCLTCVSVCLFAHSQCMGTCTCVRLFFPVFLWCPSVYPLFGDPTYEVSASYIKQYEELDMRCQPGGGGVEFRQRNLSSDIVQFTIKSGPHGNIQLLPPGIGPCVYRVTVSERRSVPCTYPCLNHCSTHETVHTFTLTPCVDAWALFCH